MFTRVLTTQICQLVLPAGYAGLSGAVIWHMSPLSQVHVQVWPPQVYYIVLGFALAGAVLSPCFGRMGRGSWAIAGLGAVLTTGLGAFLTSMIVLMAKNGPTVVWLWGAHIYCMVSTAMMFAQITRDIVIFSVWAGLFVLLFLSAARIRDKSATRGSFASINAVFRPLPASLSLWPRRRLRAK